MKKTLVIILALALCFCATIGFSGCTQVEEKVTQIKETITQVTEALDKLEEVSDEVSTALEDAEAMVEELQQALDEAEAKLEDAEAKLDEVETSIETLEKENEQLRKEINCLKGIHFAINATYEWNGQYCTAVGVCEICGSTVTETVLAVEIEGVLTAVFSKDSGFASQVYSPIE